MNRAHESTTPVGVTEPQLEQAAEWFLRIRSESGRVEDLLELKRWMEADPLNALAYRQVAASWDTVGTYASAPEMMAGRRDALDDARRAAQHRWSRRRGIPRYAALAASILIAIGGTLAWLYTQRGVHSTGLGERTTLTLQDGSVVALDARSRVRVQYGEKERLITLERGQARFDVAKDPSRPFRVRARDQAVIALGTQFNVEIVAGNVLVSMIEGHVAVTGVAARELPIRNAEVPSTGPRDRASGWKAPAEPPGRPVELRAGEGLRVLANGQAVILPKIDLSQATAWQSGKMFFDNEPLASAAERINRYSPRQIKVDRSVADVGVSGVFNSGDSDAFVEAIASYFSVQVIYTGTSEIYLTARN